MIGNAVNGALIALSAAILCRYCRDTLHLVRQANCAIACASRSSWADQRSSGEHLRMSAPGRSRTDTGDPFRGPASSLGLRGLCEHTPNHVATPDKPINESYFLANVVFEIDAIFRT